jgi:dTDP-4-amino-4,6-dideoxygalactose transaminase
MAPPVSPESHVHHLFVVRTASRDKLQAHLKERGIQALIHYPIPMHAQVPCANARRDPHGLDRTDAHAATCLSIPCHPQMSDSDVESVIDAINGYVEKA